MDLNKIHEDQRGVIYSIVGDPITYEEVSFLSTKAGLARGGCIHNENSEHLCVIQGEISYFYRLPGETDMRCVSLTAGQGITVPPCTPHYMVSITDSIIMEWGCKISEKQEKHAELRAIVNAINATQI